MRGNVSFKALFIVLCAIGIISLAAPTAWAAPNVYVTDIFTPTSLCDITSVLFTEKGDPICHPDGGLTGKGMESVRIFLKKEKIVRLFGKIPVLIANFKDF